MLAFEIILTRYSVIFYHYVLPSLSAMLGLGLERFATTYLEKAAPVWQTALTFLAGLLACPFHSPAAMAGGPNSRRSQQRCPLYLLIAAIPFLVSVSFCELSFLRRSSSNRGATDKRVNGGSLP
jgi:hypothetical protein